MKKNLRIDEVAKEFDVSRRTVERLIQKGEIQSFKVGDTRRVPAEELDRIKNRGRDRTAQ